MAFQGIDFRDLWRPDSGMTPRRLMVLVRALPAGSPLDHALAAEREKANKPTPDQIRERADYYRRQAEQPAKEAGHDQ